MQIQLSTIQSALSQSGQSTDSLLSASDLDLTELRSLNCSLSYNSAKFLREDGSYSAEGTLLIDDLEFPQPYYSSLSLLPLKNASVQLYLGGTLIGEQSLTLSVGTGDDGETVVSESLPISLSGSLDESLADEPLALFLQFETQLGTKYRVLACYATNLYSSWNSPWELTFDFPDASQETLAGLTDGDLSYQYDQGV